MAVAEILRSYYYLLLLAPLTLTLSGLAMDRFFGARRRQPEETYSNIAIYLFGHVIYIAVYQIFQTPILNWISKYSLFTIPDSDWSFLGAYIAVDFVYYWRHRFEHFHPFFWAAHVVHHNSNEFNLSTAGRLSWIMFTFGWVTYFPLVILGFSPEILASAWALNMTLQFLSHCDVFPKCKVVDYLLNTPTNHRLHHGENEIYLHRNFAGTFMIWDRLFGTYTSETEPVRIGCGQSINSRNPFTINFRPMWNYLRTGR